MEINNLCFNRVAFNKKDKLTINKGTSFDCDIVSFSGKTKEKSCKIPFRLTSKFQDDFHSTMLQVYIREYFEMKNKGFSDAEISKVWAGENASEKQIDDSYTTVKKIHKNIDKLDSSFDEVIPSLKETTYYRGIFDIKGNKAIDIVKNAKVGDIIQPDNGYPFFSTDYLEAETFARSIDGYRSLDTSVLMKVKVPKGVRVSRDLNPKLNLFETNVVLPRGIRYKVLENKIQNDRNYITLEYIDCATDRNE